MQEFSNKDAPPDFRELLLAYLLEELPAQERERVDRRMLLMDDYSAALKEAEYDLLDAYSRGELTSGQQERVYRALVLPAKPNAIAGNSPSNLELADAFRDNADRRPQPKVIEIRRTGRWALAAVAAAGIVAVGLTFLLTHRAQQGATQLATEQAGKPDAGSAASAGSEPAQMARVLPEAQTAKRATTVTHRAASAEVLTLVLPETMRGTTAGEVEAKLLPRTRFLRVVWPGVSALNAKASRSLRLEVADEQKVVATARRAHEPGGDEKGQGAVFLIPVTALEPGSYLFRVMGADGSKTPQVYVESSITVGR